MTVYLRFNDLQARGIIRSWTMLKRRVEFDGFPKGKLLGPNTRAWNEDEVNAWLASRPSAETGRKRGRPKYEKSSSGA